MAEKFHVEFELSFPPDNGTGESTTKLRTTSPVPLPIAERVSKFLAYHYITHKIQREEPNG